MASTQTAEREQLQVRPEELVPGVVLVLVEWRDGQLTTRSEWLLESVDEQGYLLSSGRYFTLDELQGVGHSYFYTPAPRWACWSQTVH